MYCVVISHRADELLKALPLSVQTEANAELGCFCHRPRGEQLDFPLKNFKSFHKGKYRILWRMQNKEIEVVWIGLREDAPYDVSSRTEFLDKLDLNKN